MMCMHETPRIPCACTTLRKASRAVSRVYDGALAEAGVTTPQLAILRAVGRADGLALSRLAEELVMDRTSLYRAIEPMIRQGWLRVEAAESGRAKHVFLTEAGRRREAAAAPLWEAAQAAVIGSLGVERWADLSRSLAALTRIGVALTP
jgi:DNA-binding MarR family transcriptional regulator